MKRISIVLALAVLLLAASVLAAPPAAYKGQTPAQKAEKEQEKAKEAQAKGEKSGKAGKGKAKEEEKKGPLNASTFAGLEMRGIGPAVVGGRIVDVAVDPTAPSTWYVAAASGGVWKTTNAGTTWSPIFEGQGSFSIGCVSVDPKNPLTVWVGSGENNSQRSVSYGDGVYKSIDGGKSWENVGLKKSEHIGKILIDPRDTNTVYVAAQGPLWAAGGDRGLYKTTDGGKTWKQALAISENTGVSDVVMDPRDSNVLYASAYQRRRHVWTLIDGGPEGAIHKSTDGGATWKKLSAGLPKEDLGRIGLAVAPSKPDTVYAIVESVGKAGGFFRSTNAGGSWEKRSDYVAGSPQYYQEIFVDPVNADRIYSVDVLLQVSEDGGKTFRPLGEKDKHVDNHVVWIDPANRDHLLVGCDGGLYETWDRGANWDFKSNMPISQFYRVSLDNDKPFYNVYGGTQDNFSLGGPSRTNNDHGIRNSDWFVTQGGDGFQTQVDPEDPNIVYAEAQYGALGRYDRKSGEQIYIQPQPGRGEPPLRWNWDAPLIISPHSHTRLYFAANRLFRSDDRGNSWTAVSPDLTRQIDRRKLKVMGKVWSADTVAYNASTSFYGNIVALNESPLKEGLLYVGTDDGLLQISENGGGQWRKIDTFPGIPENTYVSDVEASPLDADTVFLAFDNHKMGDFKPYLLRSADRGKTWTSIAGDLPERGSVLTVAQDFVNPNLLFAGTEFGLYFTIDGGKKWIQLSSLPVIAVRDIALHKRENDLAVATFGRGFYILDDYTPLRMLKPEMLEQEAGLYPVKQAAAYIEASPMGGADRGFQGSSFYVAPNPPFGAVFTYYLKEDLKSRKEQRREQEKKLEKEGGTLVYPSWEALRTEEREPEPSVILTVTDEEGNVVRRLTAPPKAGFHRVAWDLHFPASTPTRLQEPERNFFSGPPRGPMVAPGKYKVTMAKRVDGVVTQLGEAQTFEAVPVGMATLPAQDRAAQLAFQRKTARLQRAVRGAAQAVDEARERLKYVQKAILDTPQADLKLSEQARALDLRLQDIEEKLSGDPVLASRNEPTPPAIIDRVEGIVQSHWASTSEATRTFQDDYAIAAAEFAPVLADLRQAIGVDLKSLEDQLETLGAPWTPGRLPSWTPE
ncbi:MAG TPA: glycosyl hydrolase [Thermoanaerobaculia bacterium]|nr:glycosyl hydrolase [Thermoanaerobaculia bacterium]